MTRTAPARRNDRDAVVAQAERAERVGSQAWCGGGRGGVAGWVGWRAGWGGGQGGWRAGSGGGPGRVAGRVRWLAGSGGGQGDQRGMDLRSKEYSITYVGYLTLRRKSAFLCRI